MTDGIMEIPFRIGESITKLVNADKENSAISDETTDSNIIDKIVDGIGDIIEPVQEVISDSVGHIANGVTKVTKDLAEGAADGLGDIDIDF
ncbi:hypothetical protein JGH11_13280 [Dysgonomonas sp. Marseille-P4677]|uniref:hypothetical protein n=1 Tax=Dysgonomonas sp. Marseille-P4677 TaxID=2364790 RepID=UPI00191473CB|nr:hypothetical protein [Dysgonomonas sp. Marseille-P4677]MBK5721846.1 hypothetical protein [Dysgonomonas sp. Marseille-P4677]